MVLTPFGVPKAQYFAFVLELFIAKSRHTVSFYSATVLSLCGENSKGMRGIVHIGKAGTWV